SCIGTRPITASPITRRPTKPCSPAATARGSRRRRSGENRRAIRAALSGWIGPLPLKFVYPRTQAVFPQQVETVDGYGQFVKFRRNLGDDFENGPMTRIQILPVQNTFVMKDAIPEIPNLAPAHSELVQVPGLVRSMGIDRACKKVPDAGLTVGL